MILGIVVAAITSWLTLGSGTTGQAASLTDAGPWYRPAALIVELTPEAAETVRESASATAEIVTRLGLPEIDGLASRLGGVRFEREFAGEASRSLASSSSSLARFWIAHLPLDSDPIDAAVALARADGVRSVQRIAMLPLQAVPDDSLWSVSYYFHQASRRDLHAPEAWDVTTGDTGIVVAIIDTGVLLEHPDLQGQIWNNAAERAGLPGFDDDGNGFVDDIVGWDFVSLPSGDEVRTGEDWRDADNDPNDGAGHGTAVAGVVGAETDNRIGVAGTAWNVRLMALRAGWSSPRAPAGEVDMTFVAQAIHYATRMGAKVINCSFASIAQADLVVAVDEAVRAGVTIVTPSGNNQSPHYLATRPDVISVAATDANDEVTLFSNLGDFVDLSAPGINIATTSLQRTGEDSVSWRQPTYTTSATGTSFSSPFAAGAAALLQADRLDRGLSFLSPAQVLLRLAETADDISDVNPTRSGYGSGRLNLQRALVDPRGSWASTLRAQTLGPAIAVDGQSGGLSFWFATTAGQLLILDDAEEDLIRSIDLGSPPLGGLAAADLGGGEGLGVFVATADGRLHGFTGNGSPRLGWPVAATTAEGEGPFEPALGDLDGDGVLEVVWGGRDGNVWAWHADGTAVAGFPIAVGAAGANVVVALSDLDGASGVEILAISAGGQMNAIDHEGHMIPEWSRHGPIRPFPPAIARSADGTPMVIVAGSSAISGFTLDPSRSWGRSFESVHSAPVLGDLDLDGRDEIVFTAGQPLVTRVLDLNGGDWTHVGWPRPTPRASGTPLIAPLSPVAGPAIEQFDVDRGLIAWDVDGQELPGFPKPGLAGRTSSIGDYDSDGRADILAGTGADSAIFRYVARGGSWNPELAHWPTSRGNFARTGSRLYAPPMTKADDEGPDAVLDLSAVHVETHAVELSWTAPLDPDDQDGPAVYVLRYATVPLSAADFDLWTRVEKVPAPDAPGTEERVLVSGLEENSDYFFALQSLDRSGNASAVSNVVVAHTSSQAPSNVSDLRIVGGTQSSVTLAWTATGDDGVSGLPRAYLLRATETPMNETAFEVAPIQVEVPPSGRADHRESAELGGLVRGRRYWVGLRAVDPAENRSDLSNIVTVLAGPLAARSGLALATEAQPTTIPVRIHWQRDGETANAPGTVRIYDIAGRMRLTLPLGAQMQGVISWDGRDAQGRDLPAGLYPAVLTVADRRARIRIVLIR